jgi:formylglycine-generating enzyme required for sulfatase activity/tRNA A-37 threonylcarbamoyl transferase component Bud32
LITNWERLRQQGQVLSPAELCPDRPELHDELQKRIAGLLAIDDLLRATTEATRARDEVTPHEPPPLPIVPGYEVLAFLAHGGMGTVYRVRNLALNRVEALKMVRSGVLAHPDEVRRFRREAEAVARLDHPHIVRVYHHGQHQGQPYFTMEFLGGGSLASNRQRLTEDLRTAVALMEKVVRGVQHAHERDLLHRDLKPANILLDENGAPKVSDFGLARFLDAGTTHTRSGALIGTPAYMAPEQAAGQARRVGVASDVWALGAILYELLTGQRPFRGEDTEDVLRRVRKEDPTPPRRLRPEVDQALETIVLKCLEKEPGRRYASAEALANDLGRWLRGERPQARRPGWTDRLWQRLRRRPVVARFAVLIVLLGGALLTLFGLLGLRPPAPPVAAEARAVEVVTEPAEARVVLVPQDDFGEFRPQQALRPDKHQRTPLRLPRVPPGTYLVVAALADGRFHEVYRRVPPLGQQRAGSSLDRWKLLNDGTVRLESIRIPAKAVVQDMARFEGGEFLMGPFCEFFKDSAPAHRRRVAPFYLDLTEVTVGAYRASGRPVPESMAKEYAGRPDLDLYPVSAVNFYRALQYAEWAGKRLPTEEEYEFAATGGGTRNYPWGNEAPPIMDWTFGPVKQPAFDRTPTNPPVYGLYSNVAEWIDSPPVPYNPQHHPAVYPYPPNWLQEYPNLRVLRGAPPCAFRGERPNEDEQRLGPYWLTARWRQHTARDNSHLAVGFRCARSVTPRFQPEGQGP